MCSILEVNVVKMKVMFERSEKKFSLKESVKRPIYPRITLREWIMKN